MAIRYSTMPPAHTRERSSSNAGSERRESTFSVRDDLDRRGSTRTNDISRLRTNSVAGSTASLSRLGSRSSRNPNPNSVDDFPTVPLRNLRRPPPLTGGLKHVQVLYCPKVNTILRNRLTAFAPIRSNAYIRVSLTMQLSRSTSPSSVTALLENPPSYARRSIWPTATPTQPVPSV